MRRRIPILAVLLLITLAGSPAPAGDRPEVVLSISSPWERARLGDVIPLTITLERKRGRPLEVNAFRLSREAVSLRIECGGREHLLTRIHGEIRQGAGLVDGPPPRTTLARGKPLTLEFPVIATRAGPWTCRAVYRGMPESFGELVSEPVGIEVEAPGSDARIAARLDTTEGSVILDLWPDRAFNTVQNFLRLARSGFYDGLTFHRIVDGYLLQGGDPKGDGTGGPGYSIPDEIHPEAKHEKGVISLARAPSVPDSGGSQFFLLLDDDPRLDGIFTPFGRVVEGMEVLDRIAKRPVVDDPDGEGSRPVEPPVIREIRPVVR